MGRGAPAYIIKFADKTVIILGNFLLHIFISFWSESVVMVLSEETVRIS